MKRIISLLTLLTLGTSFAQFSLVYAADTEVDHLEVTAPATSKVGEAVDLTVKALSKTGEVVTNYAGIIFVIVENDNKAKVPYAEGYTFVAADQGVKTFSKGLSFTKEGTFKVVVSDFDKARIEGSTKVKVSAGGDTAAAGNELVTITSPDDNSTLGSPTFSVVGATKKSSRVQLFINGQKALEAQSDDKGTFVFEVKKTDQVKNVISVKVLDGTDKVIGESAKVTVSVGSESGPEFKSLKLSEKVVTPGTKIQATVEATAGLKSVIITAGTALVTLMAGSVPGAYVGELVAPNEAGSFPVDVSLKNDLGKETTKASVDTITVSPVKVTYKNLKTEEKDGKLVFTFSLENEPVDLDKFEFAYSTGGILSGSASGSSVPTLNLGSMGSSGTNKVSTGSVASNTGATTPQMKVITYDKSKIKSGTGMFTWYISGLTPMNTYTFTITALDANGKAIAGATSNPVEANISLASAGKCMINDVSGLTAKVEGDVSILSWDSIPEAVRYNVYKKNNEGKFVFIESVTSNSYTIHISSGPVKYEDFSIKAVCSDSTESSGIAPSTQVQTGPKQIVLFISIALLIAFGVSRRRFAK